MGISRGAAAAVVCGTIAGLSGAAVFAEDAAHSAGGLSGKFSEFVRQQVETSDALSGLYEVELRQGPAAATLRVKSGVLFAGSRKVDQSAGDRLAEWMTAWCSAHGAPGANPAIELPPWPAQERGTGCESADRERLMAAFHSRDGGSGLLAFDLYDEQPTPTAVLNAERALTEQKQAEQQRAERQKRLEEKARYLVEMKRRAVVPSAKKLPAPIETLTNEFLQDLAKADGGYAQRLQEPGNERRASRAREVWADLKYGYKFPGVDAAQAGAELAFEE